MNPEGPGLKGCAYIYSPNGQAFEYAALATNPYKGCGHACAYCYVPLITKQPRAAFNAGAVLRNGYMRGLVRDARRYRQEGITEQVMLSFTSDPYHPADTAPTRQVLETLADHGLAFCTLSKGGSRACRDLALFRPKLDAYACTLTSLSDQFTARWEPGAAPASDRIATLKRFHKAGIFTWVSLEPTIDVEASLAIVRETHRYVDLFKVGRANYMAAITRETDWRGYTLRMIERLQQLGAGHYIKKDLQPFLPAGYANPLRVPQHH